MCTLFCRWRFCCTRSLSDADRYVHASTPCSACALTQALPRAFKSVKSLLALLSHLLIQDSLVEFIKHLVSIHAVLSTSLYGCMFAMIKTKKEMAIQNELKKFSSMKVIPKQVKILLRYHISASDAALVYCTLE